MILCYKKCIYPAGRVSDVMHDFFSGVLTHAVEHVLSKGTVIARYFLIPLWQHSIHVHVYRYIYQCTVSLPPPHGPASPLPRPIAFYVFVLVSPPQPLKIVWLLINNCSMNILKRYNIAIFYSYRDISRYRLKTISRQHCSSPFT